jgi:hypothetical protein
MLARTGSRRTHVEILTQPKPFVKPPTTTSDRVDVILVGINLDEPSQRYLSTRNIEDGDSGLRDSFQSHRLDARPVQSDGSRQLRMDRGGRFRFGEPIKLQIGLEVVVGVVDSHVLSGSERSTETETWRRSDRFGKAIVVVDDNRFAFSTIRSDVALLIHRALSLASSTLISIAVEKDVSKDQLLLWSQVKVGWLVVDLCR